MTDILRSILMLLGRLSISMLFLWAAGAKILGWGSTLDYMYSREMPYAEFFLPAAIVLQILGGLSLLLGYKTRLGALLLILFIAPACFLFHDFWNLRGEKQLVEMIYFMMNAGIFGGLLFVLACGAGRISIDGN